MIQASTRTVRFLTRWLTGRGAVREEEIGMAEGGAGPATLYRPPSPSRPLPSWIVLHGITRPGRRHPALIRFARSLAASGASVLVPEIPEWRELALAPEVTVPVLRRSLATLEARPEAADRPPGVVGFSFGSPQALLGAGEPSLDGRLAAVVGFGGYCDLERTVRFQFTGEHEWRGRKRRLRPDPYGRWVIGANVLPWTDGRRGAHQVAGALHRLAADAGDRQAPAWEPSLDALKLDLRRSLAPSHRDLFDLFAPPSDREPDPAGSRSLIPELVRAARAHSPRLDPGRMLGSLPCPVHLLHGRDDRLIPFSETLRLQEALPEDARVHATVTRLFAHSGGSRARGIRIVGEAWRFARALAGILGSV